MTDNRKKKYQLPPCPVYDIEGTESWLETMAQKGWFLCRDGFFLGVASFQEGTPKAVRYRLQAASETPSIFADSSGLPQEDEIALSKSMGWEYKGKRGDFIIYMAEDDHSRELNTDPLVQAMTLDLVGKRQRGSLFSTIFWMLIYPALYLWGYWISPLLVLGAPITFAFLLLVMLELFRSLRRYFHLRQLRNRLAAGETPDHRKDWKKHAFFHRIEPLVLLVLWIGWLVILIHLSTTDRAVDLKTYEEPLPFPTMEAFSPDEPFHWDNFGKKSNSIERQSNFFAPEMISLRQVGSITLPSGDLVSGGIHVEYAETKYPWMARRLALEYENYDKRQNLRDAEPLEVPPFGLDYEKGYAAIFPTVVLVEENRVIRVSFYQTSPQYTIPLEDWVSLYAESLVKVK